MLGVAFGAVDATAEFMRRLRDKGPRLVRPADFPGLVPSSPAGYASIYLGLGGPALVVADLGASGECAFAQAFELVAGGEAARACAVAVEEKSAIVEGALSAIFGGAGGEARGEGGAALALSAQRDGAIARSAGSGRGWARRARAVPSPPPGAIVVTARRGRGRAFWGECATHVSCAGGGRRTRRRARSRRRSRSRRSPAARRRPRSSTGPRAARRMPASCCRDEAAALGVATVALFAIVLAGVGRADAQSPYTIIGGDPHESRPVVRSTEEWQRRARVGRERARGAAATALRRARAPRRRSIRGPARARAGARRGGGAIRDRAARLVLVGPGGGTAIDAWVTPDQYRVEIPAIHLTRRGGREVTSDPHATLGLPVGFLRWWFLAPLGGKLIDAETVWNADDDLIGRIFRFHDGDATVEVSTRRASSVVALRRTPGAQVELVRWDEREARANDRRCAARTRTSTSGSASRS